MSQREERAQRAADALRRVVDIGVSAACLVVAGPVIAGLGCVARRTTGGSAFFVHPRVGRGGTTFPLIKLRTLPPGTDEQWRAAAAEPGFTGDPFKIDDDDPRLTATARRMRRAKVDELPQLVNVLLGHMSLVGVRPVVAEQLATRSPDYQANYVRCRPGLTGLWQIDAVTRATASRTELDEVWFEHRTLLGDARIVLLTPLAVVADWRRRSVPHESAASR